MSTEQGNNQLAHTVAQNLGISQFLNTKAFHLSHALNLINIDKNDITCVGICKGGGTCQRHIAKNEAIKGLLGLVQVVFDPELQGEELNQRLEAVFMHLLCTQQHRTQFETKS